MIFSQDGKFLYVLCELDDLLSVFSYNNGDINHIETVKAYSGNGKGSADIHFSNDGNYLYTSHRLKNDGISIFSVNKQKGNIQNIGFVKTGIHPRNFNITPNTWKNILYSIKRNNNDMIDIILKKMKTYDGLQFFSRR